MATSQVTLYNQALSLCGNRGLISSPTEASPEAEVCNLWYTQIVERVLRAGHWPCAKKTARLALVAERDDTLDWAPGDPSPGFKYAYAVPSDFLAPRYLSDFSRFVMGTRSGAKVLETNTQNAVLIYTFTNPQIDAWEPALQEIIVYALAAHIVDSLTGQRLKARDLWEKAVIKAEENVSQETSDAADERYDFTPAWLQARGIGGAFVQQRYIFPIERLQIMGYSANV